MTRLQTRQESNRYRFHFITSTHDANYFLQTSTGISLIQSGSRTLPSLMDSLNLVDPISEIMFNRNTLGICYIDICYSHSEAPDELIDTIRTQHQ